MKISLIGMSNSGKSYWSKKLEKNGFIRLCCDDYIEEKLGSKLRKLGYRGIADVSKWLGQPYDKRYQSNSKIYLDYEKESIIKFIDQIRIDYINRNIIIDTTGSVIYTGSDILKQLKGNTKVVYLETPQKVQDEMYKSYIKEPKPVLWRKSFYKLNDEDDLSALKRCYPEFLKYRTKKYKSLADISLDYYLLRDKNFDIKKFIKLLEVGI